MTTMVIVSSPKPNHQNVRVRMFYKGVGDDPHAVHGEVVLKEGENHVAYVHGGCYLSIDEVEKDAPAG